MKQRKKDHLDLALRSQTGASVKDNRFIYDPIFSPHPQNSLKPFDFMGKKMRLPIWVSSMTGGTEYAGHINRNLARACNEFGMGMGLGSCRTILNDNTYFEQFDMRKVIGNDLPLYANLGISQVEKALANKNIGKILRMVDKLKADGLFIHINPIQEWLQPEGDVIKRPPLETIQEFLEKASIPLGIKEVGQGLGYKSLKALMKLPLEAIEFAAYGGTNFAKIELERSEPVRQRLLAPLSRVGNDVFQMTRWANQIAETEVVNTKYLIISGGLSSYLDGYYLMEISKIPSVYGMASAFLQNAREDYETLREYVYFQQNGLHMAKNYLSINPDYHHQV